MRLQAFKGRLTTYSKDSLLSSFGRHLVGILSGLKYALLLQFAFLAGVAVQMAQHVCTGNLVRGIGSQIATNVGENLGC